MNRYEHIFNFADNVSPEYVSIVVELMSDDVTVERTVELYETHKSGQTGDDRAVLLTLILNSTHSTKVVEQIYEDKEPDEYYLSMIGITQHMTVSLLKRFAADGHESLLSKENQARLLFVKAAEASNTPYQELPIDWMLKATENYRDKDKE